MEATLYYLFKSAACLSVFYLCYKLLLSRETWHRMNRMVLLFTSAAAFVLPLCIITIYREVPMNTQISIGELGTMAEIADETFQLSWSMLVFAIFIVGCAVRLCYTIYSIYKVRKIIRSGTHTECDNGTVLVQVAEEIPPFSWMKYIVISEKDYAENPTEIITHEQAHISLRHSFDILFVDLITCVQWFNPVMYLLRDDLREIHEYEADETVLNSGINAQQYQILLIKKAAGAKWNSIANSFNHSKLKNRITMMMKEKSSKWAGAKVLYVIPLVCVALAAFARVENVYAEAGVILGQTVSKSTENLPDQEPLYIINGEESTKAEVDKISPEQIEKIDVLKGESATDKYGAKAEGGAILVTLKTVARVAEKAQLNEPLYMLNGKEVSKADIDAISPDKINRVNVLKGESAIKLLGEKGKNGVIEVVLKESDAMAAKEDLASVEITAASTKEKGETIVDARVNQNDEAFAVVEKMPEFPGGTEVMMKFMAENMKYPQEAVKNKWQGRSVCQFVVERNGSISEVKVLRSSGHKVLDAEAIRMIESMPKWTPGEQRGKTVRVKYMLPVSFRL